MKATILLPTTSGRGPLLQYSAGSALRQTVRDIELFIIGDGVDESTRQAADELVRQDERVRFFDHPKHSRRGEPYRHEVLSNEANGEIVCYLCDRDLLLSNHVVEMYDALQGCDIASTLCYKVDREGEIMLSNVKAVGELRGDKRRLARLTCVAHTMEAYRSLPHGWRETPPDRPTDVHMWNQFLDQPEIRAVVVPAPTVVYFPSGPHPVRTREQRRSELASWDSRLVADGGEARIHQDCLYHVLQLLANSRQQFVKQGRRAKRQHGLASLLRRTAGRIRRRLRGVVPPPD